MNRIERRLAYMEPREEDPLVLRWLFLPNGVPQSRVKFASIRGYVDEA